MLDVERSAAAPKPVGKPLTKAWYTRMNRQSGEADCQRALVENGDPDQHQPEQIELDRGAEQGWRLAGSRGGLIDGRHLTSLATHNAMKRARRPGSEGGGPDDAVGVETA